MMMRSKRIYYGREPRAPLHGRGSRGSIRNLPAAVDNVDWTRLDPSYSYDDDGYMNERSFCVLAVLILD